MPFSTQKSTAEETDLHMWKKTILAQYNYFPKLSCILKYKQIMQEKPQLPIYSTNIILKYLSLHSQWYAFHLSTKKLAFGTDLETITENHNQSE